MFVVDFSAWLANFGKLPAVGVIICFFLFVALIFIRHRRSSVR